MADGPGSDDVLWGSDADEFKIVGDGRDVLVGGIDREPFADNASREFLSGWSAEYDTHLVAVDQIVDHLDGQPAHNDMPSRYTTCSTRLGVWQMNKPTIYLDTSVISAYWYLSCV